MLIIIMLIIIISIIIILIVIVIIAIKFISPSNVTSTTQLLTEKPIRTFTPVSTPTTEIPINCAVSDWSNWSVCSANCGGGTQERTRSIITQSKGNGSKSCPELKETKACNTDVCPVDCQVSDWSNWSTCSAYCGGGTQERTRSIITQAKGNGSKQCPELKETKACNTDVCRVDCVVSNWSNWSDCTKSCGGGTQERTRKIITESTGNGNSCPELKQTQTCNTEVCPVDCQVSDWSNWSDCTKSCGGGTQERTRSIITQPQGFVISCPEVRETKTCNTEVCPVDCQVSDWSNWSTCSGNCGSATQERIRSIITQSKGNGSKPCPELKETKACTDVCPTRYPTGLCSVVYRPNLNDHNGGTNCGRINSPIFMDWINKGGECPYTYFPTSYCPSGCADRWGLCFNG